MALARNLHVNGITAFFATGRGPLDLVYVACVQSELSRINLDGAAGPGGLPD